MNSLCLGTDSPLYITLIREHQSNLINGCSTVPFTESVPVILVADVGLYAPDLK